MSAAPTRAYVIEDRAGEPIALVRDCQNPAQAIRGYLHREGLRARVASAEDALDAIAAGVVPFSADDPTAGLEPVAAARMAALATDMRELDLLPQAGPPPEPEARPVFHRERDSEGTPVVLPDPEPTAIPGDDYEASEHLREPTQAELEASDFAHDAAREARVFGGAR